jgi:hypothetical protein
VDVLRAARSSAARGSPRAPHALEVADVGEDEDQIATVYA